MQRVDFAMLSLSFIIDYRPERYKSGNNLSPFPWEKEKYLNSKMDEFF